MIPNRLSTGLAIILGGEGDMHGAVTGSNLNLRREFAMANGETRGDVARALIAHVLNVTAIELAQRDGGGRMLRLRSIGEFASCHTLMAGHGACEIVDVWHGNKVFSARRERGAEEWKIVNFKRGDWESGFLCAA